MIMSRDVSFISALQLAYDALTCDIRYLTNSSEVKSPLLHIISANDVSTLFNEFFITWVSLEIVGKIIIDWWLENTY